jgi:hypothetical protein
MNKAAEAAGEPFRRYDTFEFDLGLKGSDNTNVMKFFSEFVGGESGMKAECFTLTL